MFFQKYRFKKRWPKVIKTVFWEELPRWVKNNPLAEELRAYDFEISFGRKGRRSAFFWDTPCGIALTYEGKEIACIGFYLGLSGVLIEQLQGMRGVDFKNLIQWEKMLLELVIKCARLLRFRSVSILRADHNEWYDKDPGELEGKRDRNKRLFVRYDVTARRRGFSQGEECWKLKLR